MPKKRGNGEGNIKKRSDGRWEARISTEDGKRKSIYTNTRQEAARLMNAALKDKEDGIPIITDSQTVGEYLTSWLETVRYQVKPSTWRRYGNFVKGHIIPALGKIPLSKLSAQQVQMLYTKVLNKGLSTTTVHHIHGMLHRALEDALRMALIQRNVTEMVKPPRRRHHEMAILTAEQARTMLAAVVGDRFEALYVLALTTGMRQGELFALEWKDVDWQHSTLLIRASVQEDGSKFIIAEPKTAYSRRRIGLTPMALAALQTHRERIKQEKALLGAAWETAYDLVFPNTVGGVMIPDNFVKRNFKALLRKTGLPDIRFHDLRHTAATLMLSRGINPKVVSEMLGHSDVGITLRIYAHVLPHMQQAAVNAMQALFDEE